MTSDVNPKTILLKGDPIGNEAIAGGAITPGDLLKLNNSAQVTRNAVAADTDAEQLIAREMELTDGDIDTDYASTDQCLYWAARTGDEYYMWLEAGANVNPGAALESNGAGKLQVHTTGRAVFVAVEGVDNSGGGTPARIRVRAT